MQRKFGMTSARQMQATPSTATEISRRSALVGGLTAGAMFPALARAQAGFPSRPVRVVVPFGAGGVTDVTTRIVSDKLSEKFGQRFIVENQPGPGGIAAARTVLGSTKDGHTVGVATNGTATSVSLFKALPFDPVTDFEMVSMLGLFEAVFVVNSDSPHRTLQDFVKAAQAQPGKLNVGTVTVGGSQYLAAELFKTEAGINFQIVTYRTSPEIIVALLRNDIDLAIEFYTAVRAPLAERKLLALATSGGRRSTTLPAVPTVQESGIPGYDVTSWNGLFVARGSPSEVVKSLNQAVHEVVAMPDVRSRFGDVGIEATASTPEELMARLRRDIEKWARVIDKAGIPKQ
jgi:tripartite-type tricarboxylate transporter receptor subunit TctC